MHQLSSFHMEFEELSVQAHENAGWIFLVTVLCASAWLWMQFGAAPLLRFPLLTIFGVLMATQLTLYILVRVWVAILEYLFVWPYERKAREKLQGANSYAEWRAVARELDRNNMMEGWKWDEQSRFYNYKLVRRQLKILRNARASEDIVTLQIVLAECMHNDYAGIMNERLYQETYEGTKQLVEDFVQELRRALDCVLKTEKLPQKTKAAFFTSIKQTFGETVLALSGGGAMGHYHFGVIRVLLDEGILPRIIHGTSAGAIIGAIVCTRTDDELRQLINSSIYKEMNPFGTPITEKLSNLWRLGAVYDKEAYLAKLKSFHAPGDITFKEAFERTGRVFNIAVSSANPNLPPLQLNYITTPNVILASAVLASCAIPVVLNPPELQEKLPDGTIQKFKGGSEFDVHMTDGSLMNDLPFNKLSELFNASFFLADQVNPHIAPFFFNNRGAAGMPSSWRRRTGAWRGGFLLSFFELLLKEEMRKNVKVLSALEIIPEIMGTNWGNIFLQAFEGHITLSPPFRLRDYFNLLADPTEEEEAEYIKIGRLYTYPKMAMIMNRLYLAKKLDQCLSTTTGNVETITAEKLGRSSTNIRTLESELGLFGDPESEQTLGGVENKEPHE